MTLAAYYYPAAKGTYPSLVIHEIIDGRRREVLARAVPGGKRDAREIAAEYGATPWNF